MYKILHVPSGAVYEVFTLRQVWAKIAQLEFLGFEKCDLELHRYELIEKLKLAEKPK